MLFSEDGTVMSMHVCFSLKAGGGNLHSGRGEGDAGRAADGGARGGGDGAHQHGSHQRAAAQAALLTGGEVLPSTAERYLRA